MASDKRLMEYEITVYRSGKAQPKIIPCREGMDILTALMRQGIRISSDCGGRGTCGKCRIRLQAGMLQISLEDRRHLTDEELKQGWRLACTAYPEGSCSILIKENESEFTAVTQHPEHLTGISGQALDEYAIAIDIGTTTIAISLMDTGSGRTLGTVASLNRQRSYGTDVISRIEAANSGKRTILQESIREDLRKGIREAVSNSGIDKSRIKKVAIACNTTMGHILLGYSCETLGRYPYTPVNIGTVEQSYNELLGSDYLDVPVIILPGISAFVGGDITAGMLACGFDQSDQLSLLIDLGTNGEMAVGNKDRILVCSTAAGPAFEGGNISSGVGSITGAICSVRINGGKVEYKTIGDRAPVGICGTGVLEIVSELLASGIMDRTGLLAEPYFETGYRLAKDYEGNDILFTQKDVRQLQLAKAATRAGMETLLRHYPATYEDIGTVYLAGGFGYGLDSGKAVSIGLLPEKFLGKIKVAGNCSLGGAIRYLSDASAPVRLQKIISAASEIQLSDDEHFNDLYIKNMNF